MKFLKYMMYVIFGLIILIIGSIYILSILRDTKKSEEIIEVAENVQIQMTRIHSQKKYYGGHGFGWGGGDVKNSIEFEYNDINYLHKTPFIPIVIKLYKENFYLVYYDRETDIHNPGYRFYKSNKKGDFKEMNPTEFPKHLAIQNRFWSDNDTPEDLVGLIPEKLKSTTTAHLWYLIEGKPENYKWDTRIKFITEYKEKHIK